MSFWKENYQHNFNISPESNDIEQFISRFFCRTMFADPISNRSLFLHGNCYWFAIILKERFKNRLPIIWYDSTNNHFYTEIRGLLYDATGLITPEKLNTTNYDSFYIWSDYAHFDPIHAERITRQCINFTEV